MLNLGRHRRVGDRRSPESPLVQTEDAKISTNMSNESIDQLPLVVGGAMRSVFDLVATVPESKGSGTQVVTRRRSGRRRSVRRSTASP